ncbi:hypothetical protein CASFOL_017485 [Castilleja foliolosa]|uniref:Uncharacterized protein n=1 Tax=Castilleja foliolosa TaxID=1961234 RepID=A0ABD3DBN9_9LAMI
MRYDSDFVIHCKPNGLCEIVGALKGAQEEDVKAVGFGGMLRISGISVTKTWVIQQIGLHLILFLFPSGLRNTFLLLLSTLWNKKCKI